ncbi:MAG: arginine--tRNA ligase [Candidatus Altiarchaeota archaeon]|nr:arginine--tRNA ligase [Candidatus Altiarchaeota archaeon]
MESLRVLIMRELESILKEKIPETLIKDVPPEIEGDYSLPAFPLAKAKGKNPKDLAVEIASKIQDRKIRLFEKVEAKDGFVNFFLNPIFLADSVLKEIQGCQVCYGAGPARKSRIIVEHTSANPDAPLHVGHLRNSIIGDSVARILRFAGYDVEVQFYVNDMGGQLALLSLYLMKTDYRKDLSSSGLKPDAWLGEQYVRANKEADEGFKERARLLQQDYEKGGKKEVKDVFDFIIATSLNGFKGTFDSYGIAIDTFVRESQFVFDGSVARLLKRLEKTKAWTKKNEVYCLDLEKYGIEKELVLMRSDSTSLYTTRDLAYHLWKLERGDCINVIANEQTLPQAQLRAALDVLGVENAEKRVRHLSYELVQIPGMRMSSREGNFVSADDVLSEGSKRALAEIEKRELDIPANEKDGISKAVGMGAIKYNILKIAPLKLINFRWAEALNFDGDSAPYLQYSHARACRILEKAGKTPESKEVEPSKIEYANEERDLLRLLAEFPATVDAAARDLKPNLIANYLYQLAEAFNRFYFKCPVLDSKGGQKNFRVLIVSSAKQVLANGLGLLGIDALERM